jgi:hypothetical protein
LVLHLLVVHLVDYLVALMIDYLVLHLLVVHLVDYLVKNLVDYLVAR